ncbi:TPA: hypothetical protein PEE30_002831 [Staphylococcus aureus]|nr:hypothetical protein [Staphylococcus aureus]
MKNDLKESSKTLEFMSVPKCVIGIDKDKKVHIHDFVQGNNLFISGQVGAGKTVLINEMVKSAMYDKSPNDIQFAFYDPTRMALKVRNEEESMFILDEAGAEKLKVHGEVIYKTDGYAKVLQFFNN